MCLTDMSFVFGSRQPFKPNIRLFEAFKDAILFSVP